MGRTYRNGPGRNSGPKRNRKQHQRRRYAQKNFRRQIEERPSEEDAEIDDYMQAYEESQNLTGTND